MTFDDKIAQAESALAKIRVLRGAAGTADFTDAELDIMEAALDLAAGICKVFQERERGR